MDQIDALEGQSLQQDQHWELYDRFALALREVFDLLIIYRALSIYEPPGTEEILKIIVGGHLFTKDDKDRRARNFQFQLRIAAYFIGSGHPVDLTSDADIVAILRLGPIYVECKRISSANQIDKRVKECAIQLRARIASQKNIRSFGLAVFDVTKLAYDHEGLSWGPDLDFGRLKFRRRLLELSREFDFSSRCSKVKGVLCVWLQLSMPFFDLSTGQWQVLFSSLYLPLAKDSGPSAEAFEDLRVVLDSDKDL